MLIPRKAFGAVLTLVCISGLILFSRSLAQGLAVVFWGHTPSTPHTAHVVLFQFKEATSPIAIKQITSKFFGLKKNCLHPSTHAPYIVSITGGKDISVENLQNGMSHAFIVRFDSNEDRDYYVKEDPAHQAFKDAAATLVEKTQVIDFQEGVFTKAG